MKNLFYIVLIQTALISLSGCGSRNNSMFEPIIMDNYFSFTNSNDTIFIKSHTWGLLGNHSEVFITNYKKENTRYDSLRDIRLVSEYEIFLKQSKDSLIIYIGHSSDIPQNFDSKINIIQIECNYDEFKKLEMQQEKLGLTKFSTYKTD